MRPPINLYHDPLGRTHLRYRVRGGAWRGRVVACPAALLASPPDPEADLPAEPEPFETPAQALFHAFRAMPLRPDLPWRLADVEAFTPLWRETFALLVAFLRRPPAERWCPRGEPGHFLQFGFREGNGHYRLAAFVLPTGKPAVLTFRPEDLIRAQPPPHPFAESDLTSQADGLPPQTDRLPWDTRVRLPIATPGAAMLRLAPRPLA